MRTIHHIIELLELYPVAFDDYVMYQRLSKNLNLTFEYVLNHHANGCWNDMALSANSSIATMQTISKVSWNWHFISLLSNSAFTEKEVSILLVNKSLNDDMIYCLGQNKNISPEFEPIKEKWKLMLPSYASNEKFIHWINNYVNASPILGKDGTFLRNYIPNRVVTVDMFLYLLTKETFHDHSRQHFISEFIKHNPNVLVNDLERLGYDTRLAIPPEYLLNINAILSIVLEHPHMERIAYNPHLQIEEFLELIKNEPYEIKNLIYKEYSFNHNLFWENVCDYSWLSFNWKHLAYNSFSNSPQYREVTLMRELLELQCVCYYPGLARL